MISEMPSTDVAAPEYFLVQYIPDPLRREASNVGVIVARGNRVIARFFAEQVTDRGIRVNHDEAKRRVRDCHVYSQWVRYWRNKVTKGREGLNDALCAEQVNFRVIEAGSVGNTRDDTIDKVVDELFLQLVDAVNERRPAESGNGTKNLEASVRQEFARLHLTTKNLHVIHPIQASQPVPGTVTSHTPSFVQYNGRPYVMNAVSFAASFSHRRIAERAGATAFMFDDISSKNKETHTIAIIHADDTATDDLRRAEHILEASSRQIVHWNDPAERERFLEERDSIARGDG